MTFQVTKRQEKSNLCTFLMQKFCFGIVVKWIEVNNFVERGERAVEGQSERN